MSRSIRATVASLALIVISGIAGGAIGPNAATADTRDYEMPFGVMGPNCKISFVMSRYMHESGMTEEHFGKIAVTGRYHASLNPNAYLRKPITIEDYAGGHMLYLRPDTRRALKKDVEAMYERALKSSPQG